jgi:putative tryptophan/tyrosine transport system substrate-binding protein
VSSRRRWLQVTLSATILLAPLTAFAQDRGRVWHVGFLSPRRHLGSSEADYYGAFPRGLRELGYVEGKNLVIEWRFADGKYERLPQLAGDMVRSKVDVIVADGTPAVLAAQKATQTIPIVFPSAGDPVGNGLVKSLARPAGNTTGISLLAGDSIVNKQLEMLLAISPRLSRVAVLFNPDNAYSRIVLEKLRVAAGHSNVRILPVEARSPEDVETGFDLMARENVGGSSGSQTLFSSKRIAASRNSAAGIGSPVWDRVTAIRPAAV